MAAASAVAEVIRNIEKSPEDRRSYRGLVLANGIRAVLVSDPDADKSSATACVRVGTLCDPRSWQGLAHFCEHMLLLGTQRYPGEIDYLRFINEHGGARNAVTTAEFTRYHFDIASEHLGEALYRLGQFFICPLFTESATQREVNAVHSEHLKNIPIDSRRLNRLDHHLANPEHDYSKYSTGCLTSLLPDASLAGELRSQLLAFHAKQYSANRMSLAVSSKDPLDQLQAMTVDAFSAVVNKQLSRHTWARHPYEGTECGVKVYLVPLRDGQKLEVAFPLVDYTNDYRSAPEQYVSHLLGHESAGSLLASLKRRGWANALGTGCSGGAAGYDFFRVSVELTEAGLASQDDVLRSLFGYIGLLRSAGPQEWIHEEIRSLGSLAFRFRDREPPAETTQRLALRLQQFPAHDLLTARAVLTEFRPDLIAQVLDQLRPDTCKVFIASRVYDATCPTETSEPYYGVRYRVEKFSPELLAACETLFNGQVEIRTSDLHLPQPNLFISNDFALRPATGSTATQGPLVIFENRRLRLWHRTDDKFRMPKLCVTIAMTMPCASTDAYAAACTQLHSMLIDDAMNSVLYDAHLAGLAGSVAARNDGLLVSLSGFSEKLPVLLAAVLDRIAEPDIDPVRFASILERYQKSLRNFPLEQPLHQCLFHLSVICSSQIWTHQQRLNALSGETPAGAAEFLRQLLARQFPVALVYGNALAAEAEAAIAAPLLHYLERTTATPSAPPELLPRRLRDVLLPPGSHHLHRIPTAQHDSSACVVFYQTEPPTESSGHLGQLRQQVLTKLLVQCLKARFFDSLRTKQQLGYMVQLLERQGVVACGPAFAVQSDRHPVELEARIDEFVEASAAHLLGMGPEQFQAQVGAVTTRLLERPKRLSAQNALYAEEIASGANCFDRAERQAELLTTGGVSQEDMVLYYRTWLAKDSPMRRKLSLHVVSQKAFGSAWEQNYVSYTGTIVPDMEEFKKFMKFGPLPVPL